MKVSLCLVPMFPIQLWGEAMRYKGGVGFLLEASLRPSSSLQLMAVLASVEARRGLLGL